MTRISQEMPFPDKNRALEEMCAKILAVSGDAIISFDENQNITMFNEGAEKIFGYSKEEVLDTPIDILIPRRFRNIHRKHVTDFMAGPENSRKMGERNMEIFGLRRSGEEFYADAAISRIDFDGKIILTVALRDITEQKEAEKKLQEYAERLEEKNRDLDEFSYIVSHDLKAPLQGMNNYAQFLIADYGDRLDEKGKEMLQSITRLSQRMNGLIDSLLEYCRTGRAELTFQTVDLNLVLKEALELLEPVLKRDDINIQVQEHFPSVKGDKACIGEVFANLIMNALKYNASKYKKIEVGYTKSNSGSPHGPVFFVKDNGIGIPENQQGNVFKMFRRLHPMDAYGGGTGSGLAIVRKIIERHGGKVWLESKEGEGSTFYFTLDGDAEALPPDILHGKEEFRISVD